MNEDRILVELNGGLGNQLFQYAAAKSLSLQRKAPLLLDASLFHSNGKEHELYYFNVTERNATSDEIEAITQSGSVRALFDKFRPQHRRLIYREPHYHYDPNFPKAGPPVLLKGIRQSEKYFLPHADEIRKVLEIRPQYIERVMGKGKEIRSCQSVSVHIRRGDYLTPVALRVLGLMPVDYYQRALETMRARLGEFKVYFFSDDIEWVRANFDLSIDHEFVSGNYSNNAIEDFFLMSQCRHNITANSSFSWWAAWLNNNPQKIVITPKKWFNEEPPGDDRDLVPDAWMRL